MTEGILSNDVQPTQYSVSKQRHELYKSIDACIKEKMTERMPNKTGQNWRQNFRSYDGNHTETFKNGLEALTALECAYEKIEIEPVTFTSGEKFRKISYSSDEAVQLMVEYFREGNYGACAKLGTEMHEALRISLPKTWQHELLIQYASRVGGYVSEVAAATYGPAARKNACR